MKKNIVKVLTNFSPFGAGPGLRRFARQEIWEAAVLHQRCESAESLQLRLLVHLVPNYAVRGQELQSGSPSLPGYKLRQIKDWMAEHVVEDFNLAQLAAEAGLSKFHFQRLFKSAVGVSPSRYHINLRLNEARRLLRRDEEEHSGGRSRSGLRQPLPFRTTLP